MGIVLEERLIYCSNCGGSGMEYWWTMGPVDNTDIDGGFDTCDSCDGIGYEGIERVEVMVP